VVAADLQREQREAHVRLVAGHPRGLEGVAGREGAQQLKVGHPDPLSGPETAVSGC
jgi:hypothetical protein